MSAIEAFEFNVQPSVNWMDDAVCKGRTKLFFAPKAERPQARVRREARSMTDAKCSLATIANTDFGVANLRKSVISPGTPSPRQSVFAREECAQLVNQSP
jgi:hypothetical protein